MRITCTGPNGENFEVKTDDVFPTSEQFISSANNHNASERDAVLRALERWCKAVGAKKEEAKVDG